MASIAVKPGLLEDSRKYPGRLRHYGLLLGAARSYKELETERTTFDRSAAGEVGRDLEYKTRICKVEQDEGISYLL